MQKEPEQQDVWSDVQAVFHVVGFALRAVMRRRKLALIAGSATLVLGLVVAVILPRTYEVPYRIQTHESQIISSLVQGRRIRAGSVDEPTRGVRELMRSREFLNDVIDEVQLEERWDEGRSKLLLFKDKLRALVAGELAGPDLRRVLRKMLAERIDVSIEGSVINVDVTWGQPKIARELADVTLDLLLCYRKKQELDQIRDTLSILDTQQDLTMARVNEAADRLEEVIGNKIDDLRTQMRIGKTREKGRVMSFRRVSAAPEAQEKRELERLLDDQRRKLVTAERQHENDLERAQERLAQLRDRLGPEHPDFKVAVQELEDASQKPPEVRALEEEVARLNSELNNEDPDSTAPVAATTAQNIFETVNLPVTGDTYAALVADPEVENLMAEHRKFVLDHNEVLDRIARAELAQATAEAAFIHRYSITEPPAYPLGPAAPKVPLIIGGALFAAICLGIALAIAADVLSGRILEPWQVESLLGTRLLGRPWE